jgi:glycosyltransferase involved in cell wall biosynthesis
MKISATIITLNESENIGATCESVAWADEILVVDSGSTDATRDLAAQSGARVITNPWLGFAKQKQFAVENALHDWILSLDADERISAELKTSIDTVRELDESKLPDGYRIARRAFYMGRWIRGGGWYPDYQLRLFNRKRGHWGERVIHESVVMKSGARVETLRGDLLHYSMRDPEHHRRMIDERYAPLGAEQMLRDGKRTSQIKMAAAGPLAFVRSYLLKAGFRDGAAGITIARLAAHHAALKHSLLYKLQSNSQSRER